MFEKQCAFAVTQFYPERETANMFRVCSLIFTISFNLFRDTLCHFVNPKRLQFDEDDNLALEALQTSSRNLWRSKDSGLVFYYNLLRKNCGISEHKNGWGFLPDVKDNSLAACIDRIMFQRNTVVHCLKSGLSESTFHEICSKLQDYITDMEQQVIGGQVYKQRVDELLSMPINQIISVKYVGKRMHVSC